MHKACPPSALYGRDRRYLLTLPRLLPSDILPPNATWNTHCLQPPLPNVLFFLSRKKQVQALFWLSFSCYAGLTMYFSAILFHPLFLLLVNRFSFTNNICCTRTQTPGETSSSILTLTLHVAWGSGHMQNSQRLPKQEQDKLLLTFF